MAGHSIFAHSRPDKIGTPRLLPLYIRNILNGISTINRYEKGHRLPDSEFLTRLVELFKCDPGWLLTGEETWGGAQPSGEELAIYKKVKGDPEMEEILSLLLERPQDKKLVLKFLKGKKDVKEALEGFGFKVILREEEG